MLPLDTFSNSSYGRCAQRAANMGGGRDNACSVLEAVRIFEEIAGRRLPLRHQREPRRGDHIWWISDTSLFRARYPGWAPRFDLKTLCEQIFIAQCERAASGRAAFAK